MTDETYLNIFSYPDELTYDIKKIIKDKLNNKYLFKEIDGLMITNRELINDFKNIPLSKSFINTTELNIPVRINYKTYKKGDIIYGELFSNDHDERVFVISHDIICEILNTDILSKIKSQNHIKVCLQNIKSTNGCFYFLASGNILF